MGCIFIIISIQLDTKLVLVRIEAIVVSVMIFSAFFLLLLASSLFLNYRGPFILGSVLYLGFTVLIGLFALSSWCNIPLTGELCCANVKDSRRLACNCVVLAIGADEGNRGLC
jgi:hypothetical protein